jgi:hypothetical protein
MDQFADTDSAFVVVPLDLAIAQTFELMTKAVFFISKQLANFDAICHIHPLSIEAVAIGVFPQPTSHRPRMHPDGTNGGLDDNTLHSIPQHSGSSLLQQVEYSTERPIAISRTIQRGLLDQRKDASSG